MQQRVFLLAHREREAAERYIHRGILGEGSRRMTDLGSLVLKLAATRYAGAKASGYSASA
jgi:hypothetical protein